MHLGVDDVIYSRCRPKVYSKSILSHFQVLPFLALGLGVDDMFLVARTYVSVCESKNFDENEIVGETLRNCGLSVTLTSFTNACAFMMASFIPVPALQAFSRQVTFLKLNEISILSH